MLVDVVTLFPEIIDSYVNSSILGIASRAGSINVRSHNPRDKASDKYKSVDDQVYGGGAGMLLSPAPYYACVQDRLRDWGLDLDLYAQDFRHPETRDYEIILSSPRGRHLDQELVSDLAKRPRLMILCGRYEGFDERISRLATMEVSLGDFVLTGGELLALSIIDSTARLLESVLGDRTSIDEESFSQRDYIRELQAFDLSKREIAEFLGRTGLASLEDLSGLRLLEYPHYTRPSNFHGMLVPSVLESGNHKLIYLWRLEQSIAETRKRRPDLLCRTKKPKIEK